MRILWWSERFWPFVGGIETLGYGMIPALRAMGHEVEVVTSHSDAELPDTDEFQAIPIHRFHFLTGLHHRNLKQIIRARQRLTALKQTFRPDLVHIHFSGPSLLFHWQTQVAHSCRTLVTLHSLPAQIADGQSLLAKSLHQADWVSSVSAHMLQQVSADGAKSSVIYNGMPKPSIPSQPLAGEGPVLLCMGRLVAWKRFSWAIELFASIQHEYETARLVLVGDGVERSALEQEVARLNLQDRVTFTGLLSKDALYEQLNRCTLVMLPSNATENIPYVAVESGWAARPVIASKVSGLPEIIVDERTGYLVDPEDKATWLERIRRLLDDPNHAQQMGLAARSYVSEKFSLEHCVTQYDALYQQLGAIAA